RIFYTISIDPTTLSYEIKRVTAISRHKIDEKIVKIITKGGRSVSGTMDHSFLVLNGASLAVKKGSELSVGNKVPIITKDMNSLFKDELQNIMDIEFDDIDSIQYEYYSGYVYDLSVEDNENFLANNIFVHNSQILQFVAKVAPKARFVSGVTASAVGLTANVRRDEFLKGGWALEAGALVLASGGIVCIDELDKISKDEMSTLHEALEQQQITVNKANIHATLKTEVSVLAAANPKFGRWDKMKSIVDQIDLPPPILNRFDLIFILRDEPDEELDRLVAEGVVKGLTENIEGIIPPELLRKYIIYTKKTTPVWTESAKKKVVDFYLTLRMAAKDQQTIPISARQLESIIRLAEASARVRLSKKVTEEDVELAKSLLMKSLREVGLNPETKTIDIDILNVGISSTQRARLSTVYEMIKDLQKDFPDGVPFQEIVNAAKEHKIEEEKVKEALDRLLREGEVYEPKPGFYKIAS
ncbi:MAG TPA: cell division protein, partial [Candidatus Nanopusillus sp.]|nr:cell division protein [Candidatus Nanopusillus sp.]